MYGVSALAAAASLGFFAWRRYRQPSAIVYATSEVDNDKEETAAETPIEQELDYSVYTAKKLRYMYEEKQLITEVLFAKNYKLPEKRSKFTQESLVNILKFI